MLKALNLWKSAKLRGFLLYNSLNKCILSLSKLNPHVQKQQISLLSSDFYLMKPQNVFLLV